MKAKITLDRKETGFEVELLQNEDGTWKLEYHGRLDEVRKMFDWTAENDVDGVNVGGVTEVPLRPVRPDTFQGFVSKSMTWAIRSTGKNYGWEFEDLPMVPGNIDRHGRVGPLF